MAGLSLGRCLRAIVAEPVEWIDVVIRHLPGRIGRLARRLWFGQRLAALGEGALLPLGRQLLTGGISGSAIGSRC